MRPGRRRTTLEKDTSASRARVAAAAGERDLFEQVFASLPAGIVVFDRRLRILRKNFAATLLLPDDDDVSEVLARLTVEGHYEDWASELREVIQTRRPRRIDASVSQGADQPPTYLDILIHPLTAVSAAGAAGGVLVAEDVTGRITMERRLAVSERLAAVGKLAARVAHELNNPLDGILRFTNLAIRKAAEAHDGKLVEYLEHVRGGIGRMGAIIGDLLQFSRNAPATFEQATINKIVEDAVSAMEGLARDTGVTVVCNFHEADMPVLRGSNIFQVFCNLIKNAIEAMPHGGTLTVTTTVVEPDVVISFEDTGIGLPADAERIFEPFFTTKAPGRGTGLGLAVCKELIEKHSGSIVACRRPEGGTAMIVRIPLRHCAAWQSRQGADAAEARPPATNATREQTERNET